ncbi:MFS transporter [Streptomyces sulfonofaciens]|uniref:MFS transporter n=1 Tax=Streptomyces sulfonofaciens TaxID=68272 RepID=A0A919G7S3_9ACTN|nr:MDR family MFS transporter [Streptomyces sulfonofaciens]GHH78978.1 MFS transporter [Streptomyces sulfonofaciens]
MAAVQAATATAPGAQATTRTGLPPAVMKLVGVILLGTVLVQLDATMTNIALNTLKQTFDIELSTLQWFGTGYMLAMASVIPATGWSLMRFGARNVWMFCIALFLVGSALCGAAWTAQTLIVFRVVQGLAGGMVLPLGTAVLAQAAGRENLGRVMSLIGIPSAIGPVLGPVLGGLIIDGPGWRWIFYANVPICLLALFAARGMPNRKAPVKTKLDLVGMLLLSPACGVIVYSFSEAGSKGSFTKERPLVTMGIGLALLAAFALHALRKKGQPIIDLRLLKHRSFTTSSLVLFLASIALFGAMAVLPMYYQQVRGYTPLKAGLLLVPLGAGMGLSLRFTPKLIRTFLPRSIMQFGLLLTAVGIATFTQLSTDTDQILLSAALVVNGAGIGAVIVPAMTAALRDIPPMSIPGATAENRVFMQIGSSFGAAVLLVVLQARLISTAKAHRGRITLDDLAGAFSHSFVWVMGFAAASVLASFLMPGRKRGRHARPRRWS